MSRARRSAQKGRQWQYNNYRLLVGPIALMFGLLGTICLAGFLWTNEVGYLVLLAVTVVLGIGLAAVAVLRLVPKA